MKSEITLIELKETVSTNTFLASYEAPHPSPITVVTTEYQTAGRGQGTNTWESERGKNLLFSIKVHPTALPITHAFALSEVIALSIRDAVASFIDELSCNSSIIDNKPSITVKWPNDIYVGDRKIGGILIENLFQGQQIRRSIIGCGVDVNQEKWELLMNDNCKLKNTDCVENNANTPRSSIINHYSSFIHPISLRQLLGRDVDRREVLDAILENFERRYKDIQNGRFDVLHADYLAVLYRRTGFHAYREPAPDAPVFMSEIAGVEPSGHLILRDTEGRLRRYAFKEIMYIQ